MKKGFFSELSSRIPASILLFVAFVCLHGCASFLQLDEGSDDLSEYDRGYSNENSSPDEYNTATGARGRSTASDTSDELSFEQRRIKRAIETRDVILGMDRRDVTESWGTPAQREVAGRGTGGHERWTYGSRFSLSGPRTVIFENGRVAGWSH